MIFDIVKFLEKQYGIMPKARALKVQVLYDLAYHRKQGCIVELGTYHGLGTAALCLGVQMAGYEEMVTVYTIDDYADRKGWIGEQYVPQDRKMFLARMKALNLYPILIQKTVREAAMDWNKPIGVLFWDTGSANDMAEDVALWKQHMLVGGIMYLRDTANRTFGAHKIAESLQDQYRVIKDEPTVLLLERYV